MNRRTLAIALTATLVSLVLGYGLLGLAAPDVGGGSSAPASASALDLAALAATLTGPDGVPPRIVVVDEPAAPAASARGGDDRYEDERDDDDRHDDAHEDHDGDHDVRGGDDDD